MNKGTMVGFVITIDVNRGTGGVLNEQNSYRMNVLIKERVYIMCMIFF